MNPNAKPFVFSASAASWSPGGAPAQPAALAPKTAAPVSKSAQPAPVIQKPAAPVVEAPAEVEAPAPATPKVKAPTTPQVEEPVPQVEPIKSKAPESWDEEVKEKKTEETEDVAYQPTAEELEELAAIEAAEAALEEGEEIDELAEAVEGVVLSTKKSRKGVVDYKEHDTREHLNIVFIGHVDAGKSTITGQLLLLTGQVVKRTIQKYEKEAKEKNRESWYLAYIMDTNEEERAKGKTVEVGRAHFATANKRYTLLDAPGHKNYVPNMIEGTAQADVGVLVISARKGEFETGFDRGGQTREHAMLAKTLGIQRLVVLVNKMDDSTVKWDKARYDQVEEKLFPFLKQWGYRDEDVQFIPCSGFTGANLKEKVKESVCPWFKGECFIDALNNLKPINRNHTAPLRIPLLARYKEMGNLIAIGKVEQGTIKTGMKVALSPTGAEAVVTHITIEDEQVNMASSGENICIQLKGLNEEDVHGGYVLSSVDTPCNKALHFEAQIVVLELLEHKPLITAGYGCILHIHTHSSECNIARLITAIDKKTGKAQPGKPRFVKQNGVCIVRLSLEQTVALELFADCPQLGRFTLRDEGKTIAIGKVTKLLRKKDDAS